MKRLLVACILAVAAVTVWSMLAPAPAEDDIDRLIRWLLAGDPAAVGERLEEKERAAARPELFHNRARYYPEEKPFDGDYVSTWHWDRIWPDGDMYKAGYQGQGLYVSPARDLVLAGFSSGKPYATGDYYRELALAMP